MRGRRGKTQVAKVARASKKIYGPTRRDYCKNHGETTNWPSERTIDGMERLLYIKNR